MKLVIVILCLIGIISAEVLTPESIRSRLIQQLLIKKSSDFNSKAVRSEVFVQKVDHENPNNFVYFDQRVFIHDAYYQLGGPVFVFITAQEDDYEYWMENSGISDIAAATGGVIYSFEPRYYGQSRPTSDLSIANLSRYFTLSQIQADFTDIIAYLKTNLAAYGSDKFVLYGYNTGATIATWIHNSNPGLVNGVVASSSPQIAVFDFKTYYYYSYQTLMANIRQTGTCAERFMGAYQEIDDLINAGNGAEIQRLFNLYEPVDTSDSSEVGAFWSTYNGILAAFIEYGNQAELDAFCNLIETPQGVTNAEAVAYVSQVLFNNQVLHFGFHEMIELYRQEHWYSTAAVIGGRQAYFLACNEWSWFRTSIMLPEPLTHRYDEDLFVHGCQQLFGEQYDRDYIFVANVRTNDKNRLSHNTQNIYFTNGEWDPFRIVSQPTNLNSDSPSDIISGVGKAFDLPRISVYDSDSVRATKLRQRDLVLQWIQ